MARPARQIMCFAISIVLASNALAQEKSAPSITVVPSVPSPQLPVAPESRVVSAPKSEQSSDAVNRQNTDLVVILVRTALVAVHQANLTGNYTVLREIGTPEFQKNNTAADLSVVFQSHRALKLDLSRSVVLDPQITRAQLTTENRLYVVGALSSEPVPINFELLFQPVEGIWRLFALSITPVAALAAEGSIKAASAQANVASLKKPRSHRDEAPPARPRSLTSSSGR